MKIYIVQEVWGDGDGYPSLRNLEVFKTKKEAKNYCTWMDIGKQIAENEETYDSIRYGEFAGFLVTEKKIEDDSPGEMN